MGFLNILRCTVVLLCSWCVIANPVCQEPADSVLRQMLNEYSPNALDYSVTSGSYSPPTTTDCPALNLVPASAPQSEGTTCPWYNIENTSVARYPTTLLEAQCYDCTNCISDMFSDGKHPVYRCERVMRRMWVLHKTYECNNGTYEYSPAEIYLAQNCVCGRNRSA
ncbi:interleukin 17-like protein [Saccoglossus kowalevskii]